MTTEDHIPEWKFAEDEGWYTDPWGRHQARWISAGLATDLVRDGEVESHEDPPETVPVVVPTRIRAERRDQAGADDLRRADEAQTESVDQGDLRRRLTDASEEGIDSSWG